MYVLADGRAGAGRGGGGSVTFVLVVRCTLYLTVCTVKRIWSGQSNLPTAVSLGKRTECHVGHVAWGRKSSKHVIFFGFWAS